MKEEKLIEWAYRIYNIACYHGWHETHYSENHWLCLVMSEVAEMVEADRKNRRADINWFNSLTSAGHDFKMVYNVCIKGSIEEEMADVVIRLLDMFTVIYNGRKLDMSCAFVRLNLSCSFPELAWYFTKEVLNSGPQDIANSIAYMYQWAENLGIDLDTHIELKIKYNALRSYKHGGKKY